MAKERSIFGAIFRNFWNSLKPKQVWGDRVGVDYNGTEYYEVPLAKSSKKTRPSRWFMPSTKDNFEQDIPPEWEAWLRYRRNDPPTEEEINRNLLKMMTTLKNAEKLKQESKDPPKDPGFTVTSKEFPVYEDLEGMPSASIKGRRHQKETD